MIKGYVEPLNPAYQQWIDENVPVDCQQWCLTKADDMAKEFPELRVVGVHYFGFGGHAWCVNDADKVVDPTAHQFNSKFNYEEKRMERADFPIGKCHWCRDDLWKDTPGVHTYLGPGSEDMVGPHTSCDEAFRVDMVREVGKEKAALIFGD